MVKIRSDPFNLFTNVEQTDRVFKNKLQQETSKTAGTKTPVPPTLELAGTVTYHKAVKLGLSEAACFELFSASGRKLPGSRDFSNYCH